MLLLLPLLLLMACAPSRHRVRLVSATDLSGTVERVDRGSASAVPRISDRACIECGRAGVPASVVPGQISGRWGQLYCPSNAANAAGDGGDVVVVDGMRPKSSQSTSCQCDRLARNS